MSGKHARSRNAAGTKPQPPRDAEPAIEFKPPLKPHKTLFIVLLVALIVWVGVLLGLYFKTIHPVRHGGGATRFFQ